jgi:hypothetical protein
MIKLIEFCKTKDFLFGFDEGRYAFQKLKDYVDSIPDSQVLEISFESIEITDVVFARESVVSLAKQFLTEKFFVLVDMRSQDVIDNWHYAAIAKNVNLVVRHGNMTRIIGPELTKANKELWYCVCNDKISGSAQAANTLNISVANASARLKSLASAGLLIRNESTAISGGREHVYVAPF